jgi:hypothetical protein
MPKTTESVQYAAQVTDFVNFNDRINDERQIGTAPKYAEVKVTMDALNVATDIINLVVLPVGAIVIPSLSKVIVTDDCTSGVFTLDIGDSEDPDRYADGINVASVGEVGFTSVVSLTVPAALHAPHRLTGTTKTLLLTLSTFGATIEAGEIIVLVAYKTL